MKTYIGIKLLKAKPMTRGEYNDYRGWKIPENETASDDGYLVSYQPDGYESWSPKSVFESAYFPIAAEDRISQADVDAFMGTVTSQQLDNKTTHVRAELLTGFVQHEVSSCVKPENYDHEIGVECATNRIKDRVWMLLGFVLQWATYGVKKA
jgi:hypothetical protein